MLRHALPVAADAARYSGDGLHVVIVGGGPIAFANPIAELAGMPPVCDLEKAIRSAVLSQIQTDDVPARVSLTTDWRDCLQNLTAILGEGRCREAIIAGGRRFFRPRGPGARLSFAASGVCPTRIVRGSGLRRVDVEVCRLRRRPGGGTLSRRVERRQAGV
jgi:hypothetical protein